MVPRTTPSSLPLVPWRPRSGRCGLGSTKVFGLPPTKTTKGLRGQKSTRTWISGSSNLVFFRLSDVLWWLTLHSEVYLRLWVLYEPDLVCRSLFTITPTLQQWQSGSHPCIGHRFSVFVLETDPRGRVSGRKTSRKGTREWERDWVEGEGKSGYVLVNGTPRTRGDLEETSVSGHLLDLRGRGPRTPFSVQFSRGRGVG